MRFDERELVLPVGVASVELGESGQQVMVLRLCFTDRRLFLTMWDLLVLAGIDPRVVSRYLRRRAFLRRGNGA
jgi:hypothetical protein